ncbi:MAG: hypothetical protein K6U80_05460 [Firmicutes bacterium]|nr:hypothetical protein [Bacillota bacterium]
MNVKDNGNFTEVTLAPSDFEKALTAPAIVMGKKVISEYFLGVKVNYDFRQGILDYVMKMLGKLGSLVFSLKCIQYQTIDPKGNPYQGQALLMAYNACRLIADWRMPVLCYHHGTQLLRKYAPSYLASNPVIRGETLEIWLAGSLAATKGYIVVMPDYQGMKQEPGDCRHPYVVAKPLGRSTADLLVHLTSHELANLKLKWNGQIFIAGYSEGGFAAMAASKEIQENYGAQLKITASAPSAGPYSISESMRVLMLREEEYPDAFYMPYTVAGYREKYGDGFNPQKAFKPEYQDIYALVDGYHTPDEVHAHMKNPQGILIPKHTLTDQLIMDLGKENSNICQALKENDLTGWKPEMPMRLYHNFSDDRVPFENSVKAHQSFMAKGANVPLIPVFGLPIPGSEHAKAFIPCLESGLAWFDTFVNAESHTLGWGRPLLPNLALVSAGRKYMLRFQLDGDLAIYNLTTGARTWHWNTSCKAPGMCFLQNNGRLALYETAAYFYKEVKATTQTSAAGDCKLVMQDDGKAVIYDKNNVAVSGLN